MFEPWPDLAAYATKFPGKGVDDALFAFDSRPGAAGAAAAGDSTGGAAVPAVPTLLLLHGLGDEADTWRSIFPRLAGRFRLVAVDLPGFGRSPRRAGRGFAAAVARIGRLLEELGPAVLVGSSLGAGLALAVAAAKPALARGVFGLDGGLPTVGALNPALARMLLPFAGEAGYRGLRGRPETAYASLRPYYADLDALPADERAFLARRVVDRVDSDSQMSAYFALLRSYAFWSLAREAGAFRAVRAAGTPLAFVWGGRDAAIPAAAVRAAADALPPGGFALIPDAGHLPQQETPAAAAAALEAFVDRLA